MHTVFALLCFVVVIHWLIFPYPPGLLHWHCGNLTIAPVPAKQPWWIWINTSCEFIMNDCITTTKQSTTKPCAYFLWYTVGMIYWVCYVTWMKETSSTARQPLHKHFFMIKYLLRSQADNLDPVKIVHMAWQHSCHDIHKFFAWLDHHKSNLCIMSFHKIWIMFS